MPKWLRILMFFIYFPGLGIGLPMLMILVVQHYHGNLNVQPASVSNWGVKDGYFINAGRLLAAGSTPTVSLGVQFPPATAVSMVNTGDGTTRVAMAADSPAQLQQAMQVLGQRFRLDLAAEPLEQRTEAVNSYHSQMRRTAERLLLVIGMDDAAIERSMTSLPGLGDGPAGDFRVAPTAIRHGFMGVVFFWAALQFVIFGRVAAWAAAEPATPGVVAISADELGKRLLSLNDIDVPWTITRGKHHNEYLIDWRYADAKWMDLARAHGMNYTYRLVLRLDERSHNARAQDRHASLDWSAGALGANLAWKAELGISFYEYQYQRVYGLQFRDGKPTMDLQYEYIFNMQELKDPVMQVVRDAGWNYRPVITFFRPIGG